MLVRHRTARHLQPHVFGPAAMQRKPEVLPKSLASPSDFLLHDRFSVSQKRYRCAQNRVRFTACPGRVWEILDNDNPTMKKFHCMSCPHLTGRSCGLCHLELEQPRSQWLRKSMEGRANASCGAQLHLRSEVIGCGFLFPMPEVEHLNH